MLQGPPVDSQPGSLANSKKEVLTFIPKTDQNLQGHVKTILDETKTVRSFKSVIAYLLLFGFLIFAGFVVAGNASSLPTENVSCTFRNKTQPSVEAQTVSQWTTQWSILKERLTPHPWQMLSTRMVKHNEHGATLTVWLFSVFDHLYSNMANLRKYCTQHLSPLWGRMTAQLSVTHHFSPLWERITVQATDVWHSLCSCINKYGWVMDNAFSFDLSVDKCLLLVLVLIVCLLLVLVRSVWQLYITHLNEFTKIEARINELRFCIDCIRETIGMTPPSSEDEGENKRPEKRSSKLRSPIKKSDAYQSAPPPQPQYPKQLCYGLIQVVLFTCTMMMFLTFASSLSESITFQNQTVPVPTNTSRLVQNGTAFGTPPNQTAAVVHNSTTSFPAPKTEMDIHWLMDVLQREQVSQKMLEQYLEIAENYFKQWF